MELVAIPVKHILTQTDVIRIALCSLAKIVAITVGRRGSFFNGVISWWLKNNNVKMPVFLFQKWNWKLFLLIF